MISRDQLIQAALQEARFEILPDDGTFYGEIPFCQGVYANADTMEACQKELREVLEEWVSLRFRMGLSFPKVGPI
jgi:predicted RNase H-like HicB family nuclease